MAVTGPGGAGKSKLLYHFTKDMEIYPKWKSVWIHTENCEQFIRFNEWRYPCNLLIVIDYAGTVASDAGKWMERLERSRYRPDKVRFVFIERGKGLYQSAFSSSILSIISCGIASPWRTAKMHSALSIKVIGL